MPGHVLFFLILPRLAVSQDQTSECHRPAQIFRGSIWNEKLDDLQLLDIAKGAREIIQYGYSVDGHVTSDLQKTGIGLTVHEASTTFRHAGIHGESYDVVNPFGDDREIDVDTMWIVDFCTDTVTHVDRGSRRSLSLRRLIEGAPTLAMFGFTGPAVPPFTKPSINPNEPSWTPDVSVNPRTRSFAHRILRDFDFQWRHVLRSDYNYSTLKVLARAVLCLSTFRFRVHEVTGERHGVRGEFVSPTMLPGWEPLSTDIIPMGDVNVVICQSPQHGLSKFRAHLRQSARLEGANAAEFSSCRPYCMLLSIKGIALCRITLTGEIETSVPEPLFNGDSEAASPSDHALDQLLWATATRIDGIANTSLSNLPVEIQDAILGYSSDGPIAPAMIGCQLDIGSPFQWIQRNRPIELRHYYRNRESGSPVESQIWFGGHMSGLVYVRESQQIPSCLTARGTIPLAFA